MAGPAPATAQAPTTAAVAEQPEVPQARSVEAKAALEAARTGRRIEVPTWRSETAEIFVNPDGSKTMEQHAVPVRVRKGSGWAKPDATLERRTDGTIQPVAAATPIVLSGGGANGELLRIGKPGERVVMGWPGRLPAPRLKGDTATYPEVFRGVDLQLKVGLNDFSYLLVVKNREAAKNPALRQVKAPIRGEGLKISVAADGRTIAQDRNGQPVFTAPAPAMWDSTPATERRAKVGIRSSGNALLLTPDQKLLADPAAKFPIYIDPSLSGNLLGWLHINVRMGNQTGWGYDTGQGAKVGRAYQDTANLYRSMFRMSTVNGAQNIAGSQVSAASFRITLDHTPTGTPTPVALWHVQNLNPAVGHNWDNTGEGFWLGNLQTVNAESYPPPEDKAVEFNNENLRLLLQSIADNRATEVSLGLRAPDENSQVQWKKFHAGSAGLSITYNTPPRMPKSFNFLRPRPCGTATAPTPTTNTRPQFSAVANDPDTGDSVTTTVQILNPANTVVHSSEVGPTVSGAAFSWPEVPADRLQKGIVYHYRAFTRDPIATGPSTPDCYFIIDPDAPLAPVIESNDFPDGEPVKNKGETGSVTFKPNPGQPNDIAEYVYGFAREKTTMRVKANADGSATIPITVWPERAGEQAQRQLFVGAVDRAGNYGPIGDYWTLMANDPGTPAPHVRGDSNGDGKADLTAVFDHGYGRTSIWNLTSTGPAFHTGVVGWDTGEGGSFGLTRTRPVQGDFNGDGRTDMAMLREGSGRQIWLYQLPSDGNRYDAQPASWTSGPNGSPLSTARAFAGDVDGDKKDDIAVQNAVTGAGWEVMVLTSASNFTRAVSWAKSDAGNAWTQSAPLLADITGDGKADLVSLRNLGGCRTVAELYRSTGTGFAAPTTAYDSGANGYCWEKSKAVVADADGNGTQDVVALYETSPTEAELMVFKASSGTLTRSTWWSAANAFDLSKSTLTAGDYNGDGKDDVGVLYACCTTGQRQAFTFASTGTSFGAKHNAWAGQVDAVTGPKFELEHRTYDLVSRNSGKCLNVEFASTNDLARYIQYKCLPVDLNARFRVDAIAGTDQYSVRPMHSMKCADVDDWGMGDGAQLIQWPCGSGNGEATANQQMTIEYVDGSSYDTVVQLKFAHSGKCATVVPDGPVTTADDYAPIQQHTCGQLTTQQWVLRPSYNADQLGENGTARYRVEAATSAHVLDIEDCARTENVRMWLWVPGSPCQSWKLESLGDDVYKIIDPSTNRAIDIEGCSKQLRGTIRAFASNDSECQRWRIEPSPGGSYVVTAVSSGLSLDVAGCSPAQGADVITWLYHGGPCQRWFFKKQ
ncbi:RICIN domain-containing protein [Kribbella sp. NBC_01245]|uniref:RICIN domain-containing protein n=1 Tax=Kribbella sp. NBC_01245 TaxID=2903578 RepID=UPI002E2CF4D0|nr:RICIN domain-containing protein [Kribbella sp. NBC_01245]